MPAERRAPTDEIVGAASFTLDVIDVEELQRATL